MLVNHGFNRDSKQSYSHKIILIEKLHYGKVMKIPNMVTDLCLLSLEYFYLLSVIRSIFQPSFYRI